MPSSHPAKIIQTLSLCSPKGVETKAAEGRRRRQFSRWLAGSILSESPSVCPSRNNLAMLSRKHFQSENFKQNSSSTKHEECSETRPSLTGGKASQQQQRHSRQSPSCKSSGNSNGTTRSSRRRWIGSSSGNGRIVTALCVAFAIATLVARNCDATSTDSQNVNGTSDIRSIREGAFVAASDAPGSTSSPTNNNNNNSNLSSNSRGTGDEPKQSHSPSLNSNLVASNFSTVGDAIRSPNDTLLLLQDAVDGGATAKERAKYVQQLEMNFSKLKRRIPIYQNEFAVHIPSGAEVADRIAHKYGFENMGQVS